MYQRFKDSVYLLARRLMVYLPHISARSLITLNAIYRYIITFQRLLYLFGHTKYSHPLLAAIKVVLVRERNVELEVDNDNASATEIEQSAAIRNQYDWKLIVIVASLFSLRAAEWIMREGTQGRDSNVFAIARQRLLGNVLPPFPSTVGTERGRILPPDDPSICPICRRLRRHPCVTPSGYVYCYSCIFHMIREDGPTCPVTGTRCHEKDLRRLFEENDE